MFGLNPLAMFFLQAGTSLASSFMEYSQQKKADKAERRAYDESVDIARKQARLDRADADEAARAELEESQRHEKLQRMMYLKSGVDLSASPLLVMEETRNKGEYNAKNVRQSGYNRADLAVQSAVARKPISRASLTTSLAQAGAGAAKAFNDYSVLKKAV